MCLTPPSRSPSLFMKFSVFRSCSLTVNVTVVVDDDDEEGPGIWNDSN